MLWTSISAPIGGASRVAYRPAEAIRSEPVTVQCDTIRILAGRNGPLVTSMARLSAPDHERVRELADYLVAAGGAYAAAGTALGTGRIAVLRRMGDTKEVRGLIFAAGAGPSGAAELITDHPLWASPAFMAGRTVAVAASARPSPLTVSWCSGLRQVPRGFRALEDTTPSSTARGTTTQGSPVSVVRRGRVAVGPSERAQVSVHVEAEPASSARWPMAVCVAATACSVVFLLMCLALAPRHIAAGTASPIITTPLQPKIEPPVITP